MTPVDRATALQYEDVVLSNLDEVATFLAQVDDTHFPHVTREAVDRFVRESGDVHIVGRMAGRIVVFGMLRGWAEGFTEPSLGIAVRRDAEGRGIGRAMMAELEARARQRGAASIRLRVSPDNPRARRLYERCGYRSVGIERGETLMRLTVEGPADQ